MEYRQKISCEVSDCMYNCLHDSTCRLDKITVSPCNLKGKQTPEERTLCSMYVYAGNLNQEEIYK